MAKNKFTELLEGRMELQEAVDGAPRSIRVNGAMTAEIVNGNRRVYPSAVLAAAVAELRDHLNESAGQGRAVRILGEAEHPSDKGGRANLLETVTKWSEITFDGSKVDIVGHVLPTTKGRDILTLLENGVYPGVSMRGYGEGKTEGKGEEKIFRVSDLHITGFDLVLEPSFENQVSLLESQKLEDADASGENEMSDELLEKLQKQEQEKAELTKRLEEAQKLVAEGVEAKAKLEESKRKSEVESAIEEACKDLPFGKELNEAFVAAFKEAKLGDVEAVKTFNESQRKLFGKFAAMGALQGMGFDGKITGVRPVLEAELGIPDFARASFEITESFRKRNNMQIVDLRKNSSPAAIFTMRLLEKFDALNQARLMQESRAFTEAETASDLSLLASVNRAVIAEAVPELTAANIFDFGLMSGSPENIYYEAFAGESGYHNVVSNEDVTLIEDSWVALAYARVQPGSVVVTDDSNSPTYVEGTDYVIDYALGKIMMIDATTISTNLAVHVSYHYDLIRGAEGAEIQRAEVGLSYKTITAAADRLADYITDEAIVFSRSQLGWDAVGRTMSSLIYQMRLNIEKGVIEKALGGALSLASNSGGTWDSSVDAYSVLAEYIGYAKVKVINRYYATPSNGALSVVASPATADMLSNWDGFTRIGFPDATLSSAGFAGMSVKGMPVFASTQMRDGWLLVTRRDMVMHRVYNPMTIKGPFPVYGSNHLLIAGQQYYAEEYNADLCPLVGKAAYVKID
jgi:hypothetical protein